MTFATKYSPEISKLILSYTINELTSSEFFQNINIILEKAKDENLLSEEMAFVMFSVCKFITKDRLKELIYHIPKLGVLLYECYKVPKDLDFDIFSISY